MNINSFKRKNIQRYITVLCVVIMTVACCFSIIKPMYLLNTDSFKIIDVTNIYILEVPILITANMFFDDFIVFKYKFNIIWGEMWLFMLFYFACRLYRYNMSWNTYTVWYYISALCGAIVIIMPFTVRACDNTGLIRVKKHDLIWITILTVFITGLAIRISLIRYQEGLTFNDGIYRLIYGLTE